MTITTAIRYSIRVDLVDDDGTHHRVGLTHTNGWECYSHSRYCEAIDQAADAAHDALLGHDNERTHTR